MRVKLNAEMAAAEDFGAIEYVREASLRSLISLAIPLATNSTKKELLIRL